MEETISFLQFQSIFAEYLGIDSSRLTREVNLLLELGVDSLSLVNAMIRLEREYQVMFKPEDAIMTRTLGEAYDLFVNYRSQGEEIQSGI
ncbi:acyl carrier protein [Paenibacillus lutimineralis]|uniref:Acyl carrier protein n=1 Tax=Paenibacillus lutimineralis TaxID=2707005 RepID=A0A3Q9I728_9BACL|nr:acyl carrier protein [Paenibacillus lutimineralis]AZS14173.1 acyl carrier protein [Paenibacillus lutimineralis]